ncbi:MAG TPA: bifunctional precorrin-2 dehydrogenase/sirohydrochlorin ferrochelatase [Gemmatimonadaceae bacterium]
MSLYPVMIEGSSLSALVVGGGAVALRKTSALIDAGASVTVVSPAFDAGFDRLAESTRPPTLIVGRYDRSHIGTASLVVAATDDAAVNETIAADARSLHRLVNVADASARGDFVTPAVHRAGPVTIAVSAGRLPSAARAIRDAIAQRFDARYGRAAGELNALRERLIRAGRHSEWDQVVDEILGHEFCRSVEQGTIEEKLRAWR